jgi:hypothetical protein
MAACQGLCHLRNCREEVIPPVYAHGTIVNRLARVKANLWVQVVKRCKLSSRSLVIVKSDQRKR